MTETDEAFRARLRDRLLARTDQDGPNGCWLWQGATANSYGIMSGGSRAIGRVYVHRVSYELFKGPIPEGLHIDHLCRVRTCVNPEHLEAVTQKENTRRGYSPPAVNGRKETCVNGHPLAEGNLRTVVGESRQCLTCARDKARAKWPDRKKGMAHLSTLIPDGLYVAARAKAQANGTSITAIVHEALVALVEAE